jgi:hypothetical protein
MRIKAIDAAADADDAGQILGALTADATDLLPRGADFEARLLELLDHVRVEIGGLDTAPPELTGQVEAAITEFRRVARGIHPSVLADHGLAAALGSLLETVARPTTLKAADLPRFPAHIEACVYSCLAKLLGNWPDGEAHVLIAVSARDGRLGVILFDPETSDFSHIATAAEWEAVATRIAVLNGTLAASPNFGGLIITIDVPATKPVTVRTPS